jgi:sensor c-di-GMP phosphodiesterase-like protein
VAEGVESAAQKDWLIEHGVAFGQGYLFSAALPVGSFLEYVRANRRHSA